MGGKKLKCRWEEFTHEGNGTKIWSKTWYSTEIPGGIVKHEDKTEAEKFKSTNRYWAVEYKIP